MCGLLGARNVYMGHQPQWLRAGSRLCQRILATGLFAGPLFRQCGSYDGAKVAFTPPVTKPKAFAFDAIARYMVLQQLFNVGAKRTSIVLGELYESGL